MCTEKFKKLAKSFYGCTAGNINAPIWFCGLEWGGGYDSKFPILEQDLEPYEFEELQCRSAASFKTSFWASRSPYCRNTLKILVNLFNLCAESVGRKPIKFNADEVLENEELLGVNGYALMLNGYPISFSDRSNAWKQWNEYRVRKNRKSESQSLPEWCGIEDKTTVKTWDNGKEIFNVNSYYEKVVELRAESFKQKLIEYKPKLVICFGKNELQSFCKLWGISDSNDWDYLTNKLPDLKFDCAQGDSMDSDQSNCWGYWVNKGETLLMVVPFPANAYGLSSDGKIENTCQLIHQVFGNENWLNVPVESKEATVRDLSVYEINSQISSDIREFRNRVNEQLVYLEGIKTKIDKFNPQVSLPDLPEELQCRWNAKNEKGQNWSERVDSVKKQFDELLYELDDLSNLCNEIHKVELQKLIKQLGKSKTNQTIST